MQDPSPGKHRMGGGLKSKPVGSSCGHDHWKATRPFESHSSPTVSFGIKNLVHILKNTTLVDICEVGENLFVSNGNVIARPKCVDS